jgi:hypothetical protein
MELMVIALVLLGLVVFDLLALRFGADSRATRDRRPNWW